MGTQLVVVKTTQSSDTRPDHQHEWLGILSLKVVAKAHRDRVHRPAPLTACWHGHVLGLVETLGLGALTDKSTATALAHLQ